MAAGRNRSAQQTPGSFENGWALIGIVVVCLVAGYPLVEGRRMVAMPLAVIGAVSALYIYFTSYRFANQFAKRDFLFDMGSGWWLALGGSLLVVVGGGACPDRRGRLRERRSRLRTRHARSAVRQPGPA